jgi:hypothetical protein
MSEKIKQEKNRKMTLKSFKETAMNYNEEDSWTHCCGGYGCSHCCPEDFIEDNSERF